MTATIAINTIIEWLDSSEGTNRLERVLWIDALGKEVVVFALFNPRALPEWKDAAEIEKAFADGIAIKRISDPYTSLALPDSEILQKHRERRDRAWEIIKDLVVDEPDIYKSEGRGRLLHHTSEQFGVQTKTVYKYLRKYWAGGKTKNALLPAYDRCGAPGKERKATEGKKRGRPPKICKLDNEKAGINVDDDVKRIFRVAIQLYYNNKDKAPLKRAYDLMIEKHFNRGYREEGNIKIPVLPVASELPTFGQFRYWYTKELNLRQSITAREGKRGFALRHRAVLGNSTRMAIGPGSIYQIDATIADVYLVSSFDRSLIIGRPVIYVVIDVFSRMITGLYIGLEGPSWIGAMMALANATIDKVAFCAEYGIEISGEDWPCRYLPETILADRGELEGMNADNLVDSLNITVANTPPYRADWKGIVEQTFRLANLKTIHWLPGAVKERYRERGERDHRLDATLDLYQFTKILILTAINHNLHHRIEWYLRDEFMIQEQVEPIPINLWQWGIKNRSGHLRERSPEIIMMNLMPKGDATVTFKGIRFKGMYYSCERAIQEQWFERARAYGSWTVPISYDPRKTDMIYLHMNGGKEIETCQLLEAEERYKGHRLEEVLDLLEFENMQTSLYADKYMQSKAELNARIEAIVAEAKEQTEFARSSEISDRQRLKNIRQNRSDEKERIRKKEAWDLGKDKVSGTNQASKNNAVKHPGTTSSEHVEESIGGKKVSRQKAFLDLLKGQRKGK